LEPQVCFLSSAAKAAPDTKCRRSGISAPLCCWWLAQVIVLGLLDSAACLVKTAHTLLVARSPTYNATKKTTYSQAAVRAANAAFTSLMLGRAEDLGLASSSTRLIQPVLLMVPTAST